MTTTPHLLHTRGFLTLPPAAQSKLQASDSGPSTDEERAREVRRTRERAEKTLTKEVDARRVEAPIDEESEDGPQSSSRLGFPVDSDIAQAYADPAPSAASPPSKYYIKRNDTLQGIALRFGLDASTLLPHLCRLNGLPPSTLSTTPHLLHTRGFLTLPPAVQSKLQASDARPSTDEERAREARRARERAEKRLQTLTKEVDWRVAKAYIALADDADEADAFALKQKELGAPLSSAGSGSSSRLEALAVDRYLDDLEWEADQLRAGRSVHIPPLPLHGGQAQLSTKA
ncbi:hypothetical protein B0H17DRAFT_954497 [Mycena rosella]|uniref:LysM domain-containing protein n=1 Tax=Mycena rosella TaxID=1033263 RepID=A0AAD7G250_MYCRO|nr:hypothetical protein B0H17DRAFT_954497 [Mycena rosella]